MTTILHLHIPRTAGSTLDTEIRAALPDKLCLAFTSMQRLQEIADEGQEIALFSGHFSWGVHEFFEDYLYITVLRNPVDRVISTYDYIRATESHPRYDRYNKHSLRQLLTSPKSSRTHLSNGMVRQICGAGTFGIPVNRFHLERAWEILCRPDVMVGFTDNLDELRERLSARIGRTIPSARKKNVSQRTPVDSATIEMITGLNRWDMELYRRALTRFGGAGDRASCAA
jgi:hypothetical protein